MKLYMHPVSTASRPVRLFLAENNIPCEEVMVDILTGAHHQEPYASHGMLFSARNSRTGRVAVETGCM